MTSKKEIYDKLPAELIPFTLFIDEHSKFQSCQQFMSDNRIDYPVILKPDLGLRGLGIKTIHNETDLCDFVESNRQSYLLQEFVDFDQEIGVFVIRNEKGQLEISSIVVREFMTVVGNGKGSLRELVESNPRYAMQLKNLDTQSHLDLSMVLSQGEQYEFAKIGNHSLGTIFRNGMSINSDRLLAMIRSTLAENDSFNYGRLDIKYRNLEELYLGKQFKIIELNGVFSEPAHIYDPEFGLFAAWKVLLAHFKKLYQISLRSIKAGNQPLSFIMLSLIHI